MHEASDEETTRQARSRELVGRLLEQCAVDSTTGSESALADVLEARYRARDEAVVRVGDSLVVGDVAAGADEAGDERPLVLLVGHLDVVPPTEEDHRPRLEQRERGEVVVGRGASDMKSGNVLAMRAFEDEGLRRRAAYRLALVLYAGEEGPAEANELRGVLDAVPGLRRASLAVVLEPTDGEVQLGCLGGLHAVLTFRGRQAHSARPWHGSNALTGAAGLLTELAADHVRPVDVDGVRYHDVWSATQAWTEGLGPGPRGAGPPVRNVLPAAFHVNLNFRFAPSRSTDEAEAELRARVGDRAAVEVVDVSPPAPPHAEDPLVRRFVAAVGAPVAGKQAWTDVARFAEIGVPALNFGPGLTAQAHQRGEHVPVAALVDADVRLRRFLMGDGGTS